MQHNIKPIGMPIYQLNTELLTKPLIHLELIQRYKVMPIAKHNNILQIGVTDPIDYQMIESIRFQTGLQIQLFSVSDNDMQQFLQHYQKQYLLESQLESTLAKITPIKEANTKPENIEIEDEPVTIFVASLFQDAWIKKASDVHIEPHQQFCRIRFRCDGILNEIANIPIHLANRVITRLKIMANLNIAERRLPQDGRISHNNDNKMDIRINTCPTLYGEKIVLRILKNTLTMNLAELGFLPEQYALFLKILSLPQGMILVTGPTGSGKTLTLYSALHHLNQQAKNICTLEDPVEIELPGINQINIYPKLGLDFTAGLRSLLRQDPDVIMLGEMRDTESASIALQAAQTGHLVLTTLHTNSAIEAIMRLKAMGISSYNIVHSITLIVAQRLIRQLCLYCKQKKDTYYIHQGCEKCYHGYAGRTGIFECLIINNALKELILSQATATQIQHHVEQHGFISLLQSGEIKLRSGMTSQSELFRVLPIIEDKLCLY